MMNIGIQLSCCEQIYIIDLLIYINLFELTFEILFTSLVYYFDVKRDNYLKYMLDLRTVKSMDESVRTKGNGYYISI